MQIEIKHLQQSLGITMVYVTHDQSEALTMSDRIAVFHQGVVQQLADPETLYKRPANRFVADFIGENNLVPVQISSVSSGVASVCASDGTQLYVPIEQGMIVELGSAYLAIRPECLYVRKNLENNNNNNIFQGVIAETFFLGDHVRLVVNALGESMTTRLSAQHAGQFRIGDRIELYCAHNDTQLLLS